MPTPRPALAAVLLRGVGLGGTASGQFSPPALNPRAGPTLPLRSRVTGALTASMFGFARQESHNPSFVTLGTVVNEPGFRGRVADLIILTGQPGSYSTDFVAYLLRNYETLPAGLRLGLRLPRAEWSLGTRAQRHPFGSAIGEQAAVLRSDLERGLAQLDETARRRLLAAQQPAQPLCRISGGRPPARTAQLRRTVHNRLAELTAALTGQAGAHRRDT